MSEPETEPQPRLIRVSTLQGPRLEGTRTRVEPIGRDRALALLAGHAEPELDWEQGFPPPSLLASLQDVIDNPDGPVRFGPFYAYVIVRRADGLAVGDAGFFGPPGAEGEVEIGYALVPAPAAPVSPARRSRFCSAGRSPSLACAHSPRELKSGTPRRCDCSTGLGS